jgi:hypothetical protein
MPFIHTGVLRMLGGVALRCCPVVIIAVGRADLDASLPGSSPRETAIPAIRRSCRTAAPANQSP